MTPRDETRAIIAKVAERHGFAPSEIASGRRYADLVAARREAIRAVAEARPEWGSPKIGELFGCDHKTVLRALKRRAKS